MTDKDNNNSNKERRHASDRVIELVGVVGQKIDLPCDVSAHNDDNNAFNIDASDVNDPGDAVSVILWHKDDQSIPVYSVDARAHDLRSARKKSGQLLDGRASLDIIDAPIDIDDVNTKARAPRVRQPMTAMLRIQTLMPLDDGYYECRVDYRHAGTRITKFLLKLIVPPEPPTIRVITPHVPHRSQSPQLHESSGIHLMRATHMRLIGPFDEHDRLLLECDTLNVGSPPARLVWLRNGVLLQQQQQHSHSSASASLPTDQQHNSDAAAQTGVEQQVAHIRLEIASLERNDLMANITCRAEQQLSNELLPSQLPAPIATSVLLDLNLRPTKARIAGERAPLSADKPVEVVCRASGSRPPAEITWWKSGSRLPATMARVHYDDSGDEQPKISNNQTALAGSANQTTVSTLLFVPSVDDAGAQLTCRADNKRLSSGGPPEEDSWRLDIQYAPRVHLALGDKLRHTHIREGNDVYFECSVRAAPATYEIRWWHDGRELDAATRTPPGVIVSNHSLVLQRVQRQQRGRYTCSAVNNQGEGHSAPVHLRIQHAPSSIAASSSASTLLPIVDDIGQTRSTSNGASHHQSTLALRPIVSDVQVSVARDEPMPRVMCQVESDPPIDVAHVRWAWAPASPASDVPPNWIVTSSTQQQQQQQHQQQQLSAGSQQSSTNSQPIYLLSTDSSDGSAILNSRTSSSADNANSDKMSWSQSPEVPISDGWLLCVTSNAVGVQQAPCAYRVTPVERPDSVHDCRLANAGQQHLTVMCALGYDVGGLGQTLHLEAYEANTRALVANLSTASNNFRSSYQQTAKRFGNEPEVAEWQSSLNNNNNQHLPIDASATGHAQRRDKERDSGTNALATDDAVTPSGESGLNQASATSTRDQATFVVPSLRPATQYYVSIYASNAKGVSKPIEFSAATAGTASALDSMQAETTRNNRAPAHLLSSAWQMTWSPYVGIGALIIASLAMLMTLSFVAVRFLIHPGRHLIVNKSPANHTHHDKNNTQASDDNIARDQANSNTSTLNRAASIASGYASIRRAPISSSAQAATHQLISIGGKPFLQTSLATGAQVAQQQHHHLNQKLQQHQPQPQQQQSASTNNETSDLGDELEMADIDEHMLSPHANSGTNSANNLHTTLMTNGAINDRCPVHQAASESAASSSSGHRSCDGSTSDTPLYLPTQTQMPAQNVLSLANSTCPSQVSPFHRSVSNQRMASTPTPTTQYIAQYPQYSRNQYLYRYDNTHDVTAQHPAIVNTRNAIYGPSFHTIARASFAHVEPAANGNHNHYSHNYNDHSPDVINLTPNNHAYNYRTTMSSQASSNQSVIFNQVPQGVKHVTTAPQVVSITANQLDTVETLMAAVIDSHKDPNNKHSGSNTTEV
ncbi:Cell adhesion molecule 2, partial [Fragariocoptes setiger]